MMINQIFMILLTKMNIIKHSRLILIKLMIYSLILSSFYKKKKNSKKMINEEKI